METTQSHTIPAATLDLFALGGHATLTLHNSKTDNHFTFQIRACADKPGLFFVAVLTGPENTSDYTYLGTIRDGHYAHGRKSRIGEDAQSAQTFAWFWAHRRHLPACISVLHDGTCGRCGRTLTEPESLARGIGPTCWATIAGN